MVIAELKSVPSESCWTTMRPLEVMELSTGKPKNTDALMKTVYLRTKNNKVSDIVAVETKGPRPGQRQDVL